MTIRDIKTPNLNQSIEQDNGETAKKNSNDGDVIPLFWAKVYLWNSRNSVIDKLRSCISREFIIKKTQTGFTGCTFQTKKKYHDV